MQPVLRLLLCDSEMNEYKEVTYKLLKFRTHKIRAPNGKLKCPFCGDKEQVFQYTSLLQHAIRVAGGSEDSTKKRANHFAVATYLVTDLANEAPPEMSKPSPDAECGNGFKTALNSVQECYQKLVEKLNEKEEELQEKEKELSCIILKELKSNSELQGARKALIQGFQELKDMPSQSPVVIGVKNMGELDLKTFIKAYQQKGYSSPHMATRVFSTWQEKLKNPEWHPFRIQDLKGFSKRVVNDEDETLKGLKKLCGVEIYDAVVTALEELQGYNSSGCYPVPKLWNFKENRKAKLEEVVNCLFTQLKTLKRKRA